MPKIRIVGMDKLAKKLGQNAAMSAVRTVVQKNGADLQTRIQQEAEFSKGYQTGTTKRSVNLELRDGGFTAESGPTTEYSPYVEYGTRYMEAQPFVRPAFDAQKEQFKRDMDKLVR